MAFIIAVDCSTSMQEITLYNNMVMSKAHAVEIICNLLIDSLVLRATRFGDVGDYYDIGIIGYSGRGVESLIPYCDEYMVSIKQLAQYAPPFRRHVFDVRLPDGRVTCMNCLIRPWIDIIPSGRTPMYEALTTVYELVKEWCSRIENRESNAPVIYNITDGESSDGSPLELVTLADKIIDTGTKYNKTILANIHLGTSDISRQRFPADCDYQNVSRQYATLFRMSSVVPPDLEPMATMFTTSEHIGPYRAFAYNSYIEDLLNFIRIGTDSVLPPLDYEQPTG